MNEISLSTLTPEASERIALVQLGVELGQRNVAAFAKNAESSEPTALCASAATTPRQWIIPKVGDKVRVTDRRTGHGLLIGDIATVTSTTTWWLGDGNNFAVYVTRDSDGCASNEPIVIADCEPVSQ